MKTLKSPLARLYRHGRTRSQNSPVSVLPCGAGGQGPNTSEDGYVLLAVLFLVALILIGLAVAAPKVAQDIRRDKETELYHRGMQYARAIKLYYKKTGNYPTDLSQLENTNNIRFLRKRYVDPITGQPFRIIHQGEAKAPLLGLFGQPLAVQPIGTTPTGNPIGSPIAGSPTGTPIGPNSLTSGTDGSSTTASTGGTTNPGTGTGTGAFGSSTGTGAFGSTTGTGAFGSTTVVGPIVGVSSTSPKESIRVYKKQTHYNQWEFVYDPMADGIVGGGQPALNGPGTTTNPASTTPPTGGSTSNPTTPQSTQPAPPTTSQ